MVPMLTSAPLYATSTRQIDSFSFPFSKEQLQQIPQKPGQYDMASKASPGVWSVESVDFTQPLVLGSDRHQISPEFIFKPDRIDLFGNATLFGVRLGTVDDDATVVEINNSAFLEVAINGVDVCEPERQPVPEQAQITLYSGRLVWNGCGQIYWPEGIEPKRSGQSWEIMTELIDVASGVEPGLNSTLSSEFTKPNSSSGLTTYQIAGIVIGVVVVVVMVAGLIVYTVTRSQAVFDSDFREPLEWSDSDLGGSLEWVNEFVFPKPDGSGFQYCLD